MYLNNKSTCQEVIAFNISYNININLFSVFKQAAVKLDVQIQKSECNLVLFLQIEMSYMVSITNLFFNRK